MRYEVIHRTHYSYQNRAVFSQHLMRLAPRESDLQTVIETAITLTPTPDDLRPERDMFGNLAHVATVSRPHSSIQIHARSVVERTAPSGPIFEASASWEAVRDLALGRGAVAPRLEAAPFVYPTGLTEPDAAIEAYVRDSFPQGRPVLAGALELSARIHADFEYIPGSTSVETLPTASFATKRGVCQDFAHVMLAGLRALRIPARYVSGYLRTLPPPGQRKLRGSDASHAWVSVWDPALGWVDFDPTNDMVPGLDHVTLAWARDFADVSPVSGVVIGAGHQILSVGVDVLPLGPEAEA